MLATRENITKYIPQREPMVMIHNIVEADDISATTSLTVESTNVFVFRDKFSEPGLVENIAQTAAAHVGFQCEKKNTPVPIGYIAAVKDLKVHFLPGVGDMLTTSIKIINHVMDVTLAKGEITLGDRICCSCEMRIFVKP